MHRVAITGLGIICALGNTCESVTESLFTGRSGIGIDPQRSELGFLSPLTGKIAAFIPSFPLSRKQRKTMPVFAEWAYEASMQAISMSGLLPEAIQNEQSGIIFGCDSSSLAAIEQVNTLLATKDTSSLGSSLVFKSMTSCISMNLSTLLGTQGAAWSISAACASSGHAVGQAADLIALGRQERMLCGGAQEINWQSMCSFDGLGVFSQQVTLPAQASRPFDAARDGLVPSGGAAAIMLERYDLAQKRGAAILGELIGYGFSSDGEHIATPSRKGLGRAMRQALSQGKVKPQDISYLCAHATSTPTGDRVETLNIIDIFGKNTVPVSSTKGLTGHELWMSGAAQVVYSTLMAQGGFTAANANFNEPDETTCHLNIIKKPLLSPPRLALCNAAGFGGTNASLLLRFGV